MFYAQPLLSDDQEARLDDLYTDAYLEVQKEILTKLLDIGLTPDEAHEKIERIAEIVFERRCQS